MTLVDRNVVIDVLAKHPKWLRWSAERLERAGARWRIGAVVDQQDHDP